MTDSGGLFDNPPMFGLFVSYTDIRCFNLPQDSLSCLCCTVYVMIHVSYTVFRHRKGKVHRKVKCCTLVAMSSNHYDAVVSRSASCSTMHRKRALSASYALCIVANRPRLGCLGVPTSA